VPPAPCAWPNRTETNPAASDGNPRGASARAPNATRAAEPSRRVKAWGPISRVAPDSEAEATACSAGSPSGASATSVAQAGPNSADASVCVTT
jgi:hypothetical protein